MPDKPASRSRGRTARKRSGGGQDPALLRRLLRAKDRMDAASHEEWPVPRLARVSGVSEAHFARSFKQAFGVPPHRYLLTRRIERAKTMLRDTDLAVTEIAFQTGWNSLGTFGRIFRDVTGESPSGLRAREKAAGHALATELRVLALHGLLHLMGYDHERDAGRMARLERRLRRKGGLREGLIERSRPTS